ncbi:MAG: hypothetical protein Kow00128_07240 [Deltaproteobacteria bacterium]
MGRGAGNSGLRLRFAAGLLVMALAAVFAGAAAAEYPRKVAIAPLSVLTSQEDLQKIAPLLPRLLSSRIMALSGAEVLLLPEGKGSPKDEAVRAGYPLLLSGTVAKLGAGYSIDLTADDLAGGKTAGAFFAAAETIDAIIPRLGDLAADISEKLFGVKTAVRTVPVPAPAAPAPSVPTPQVAPGVQAAPAPMAGVAPAVPSPSVPPPVPKDWTPSSLKKVAESGSVFDEFHGVVTGDADSEGNGEVVAYGIKGLYLFRVKGDEILPGQRITEGLPGHILNVATVDLDGDRRKEILVTGIDGETLRSSVWTRKREVFERIADRIPYFLVLLPDWQGREVVAGQQAGSDEPFHGRFYAMNWDGKGFARGEALPADTLRAPFSSGILGLTSAKFGKEWKWIFTDENDNLRVIGPNGISEYKSGIQYGWSGDSFEWGLYLPRLGKTRYMVRKAARVSRGPAGRLMLLVPEQGDSIVNIEVFSRAKRLVLLEWNRGEFEEKAGTPKGDRIYSGADFLPKSVLRPGGKVVASAIVESDSVLKKGVSRIVLFRVE